MGIKIVPSFQTVKSGKNLWGKDARNYFWYTRTMK